MHSTPLVVDLDGTLIHTDMLHESAINAFHNSPLSIFNYALWLRKGKANLKKKLAAQAHLDSKLLPYNLDLLSWLKEQKSAGRKLILCTASDQKIANSISLYVGLFDEVIASNGEQNLAGKNKAAHLESRFGHKGFDYIGNSKTDLWVWARARRAILVNASDKLVKDASQVCEVEKTFEKKPVQRSDWKNALRIHQWLKNLLLLVPFLAAHQLTNPTHWIMLSLGIVSFCLCASSVYITNDLLDINADREHLRKNSRPFAAGRIPLWQGVVAALLLLLASLLLANFVNTNFLICLMIYFVLTCAYSIFLKRIILIDCITLALLYLLRIYAGSLATEIKLSFWILAFSIFLFLSLAFVKRYAELEIQLLSGKNKIVGRGYLTSDAPLIQSLGIASGYASVLVLALYINSDAVIKLYRAPEIVWGTVPILIFWISWVWLHAHRGQMHDDPLVFAVKDKASLLSGFAFALVIAIGGMGMPW
jgi:4-hydroxybenzoate polyprenyltransferase/phosphoserine phosphatase